MGADAGFTMRGRNGAILRIEPRFIDKRRGYEGWQALVKNGIPWVDLGYRGNTAEDILRQLRRDGWIQ